MLSIALYLSLFPLLVFDFLFGFDWFLLACGQLGDAVFNRHLMARPRQPVPVSWNRAWLQIDQHGHMMNESARPMDDPS